MDADAKQIAALFFVGLFLLAAIFVFRKYRKGIAAAALANYGVMFSMLWVHCAVFRNVFYTFWATMMRIGEIYGTSQGPNP